MYLKQDYAKYQKETLTPYIANSTQAWRKGEISPQGASEDGGEKDQFNFKAHIVHMANFTQAKSTETRPCLKQLEHCFYKYTSLKAESTSQHILQIL